ASEPPGGVLDEKRSVVRAVSQKVLKSRGDLGDIGAQGRDLRAQRLQVGLGCAIHVHLLDSLSLWWEFIGPRGGRQMATTLRILMSALGLWLPAVPLCSAAEKRPDPDAGNVVAKMICASCHDVSANSKNYERPQPAVAAAFVAIARDDKQ